MPFFATRADSGNAAEEGLWKFLVPYLRPHRGWLIFALALNAFHGAAISFQTLVPKYLIDDVLLAKGIATSRRYILLAELLSAYLVVSLVCRMLVWHWSYRIFTRIRENVIFGLRADFFRHINSLCLRFHGKKRSGELFSYLFGAPLGAVQQYFGQLAVNAPGATFTLATSLLWIFQWDRLMTLVVMASIGMSVLLMRITRLRMQRIHKDFQYVEGNVSGHVADLIRGSREVKLYAMEEQVIEDFELQAGLIRRKTVERDVKWHMQFMKSEAVTYFSFVLLCGVGAWRFLGGALKVGELQAYLGAFVVLQGPLQTLVQISSQRGAAQASIERLNAVLRTSSSTPDPGGKEEAVPLCGDICLEHIRFAYEKEPILEDLNLRIPYGQHVALVGPSGSGKTTLVQLLLRLYDPNGGSVRLGGTDLRRFSGTKLRRCFGVVPQDPYFFQTTLRENLCVALPDADDAAIRRACEEANAWEFIETMPAGLDTPVGERGSTLSGGQRQRLAIARAVLNAPPFFVFDEATSALDTMSERLIQDSLNRVTKGRTAVFIAHRLATVRTCDRILVLSGGRIVQDGSFAELSEREGLFKQMLESSELLD
ncbi:MAG: ABC transporter ATP-binding protein [Chthoniobacteraceae bacterium]|nr:ABC transporter ATP-binding protein [Chthoniobacteraceae bacterium]